jgi:hypothetical protein
MQATTTVHRSAREARRERTSVVHMCFLPDQGGGGWVGWGGGGVGQPCRHGGQQTRAGQHPPLHANVYKSRKQQHIKRRCQSRRAQPATHGPHLYTKHHRRLNRCCDHLCHMTTNEARTAPAHARTRHVGSGPPPTPQGQIRHVTREAWAERRGKRSGMRQRTSSRHGRIQGLLPLHGLCE